MRCCAKCGSKIPVKDTIDGKVRNLQRRKYCLGCSPFGSNNRKKLEAKGDGRGQYRLHTDTEMSCVGCMKLKPTTDFYRRGSWWMVYCKTCMKQKTLTRHQMFKIQAIKYKGGVCVDCGDMPHPAAMQFHHTDPKSKDFDIAHKRSHSFDSVKLELDKCVLLCSNCHAIRHAGKNWATIT